MAEQVHVVVVPGLGVRSYAVEAVQALRATGADAVLLRAPAWRGAPWSTERYGRRLAAGLERRGRPVDLLVGLSVGTQAAAAAALRCRLVRALLLVSPMVDPVRRTHLRLLVRWLFGPPEVGDPSFRDQLPDWSRAGVLRLVLGFHSAVVATPLEQRLPMVRRPVTVVHAGRDELGRGQGGLGPQDYLRRPHSVRPDDEAPEAEWGAPPSFGAAVRQWAAAHGHPVVPVRPAGPHSAAAPVAELLRSWTRQRGGAGDHLIVPSFVLGDPWRTIELGRVPFWTFFPVEQAAAALDAHLAGVAPYRMVDLLLFQHGVASPGSVTPNDLARVVRRHGAHPRLLAIRATASPHDIGALGRYGAVLRRERGDAPPYRALPVADVAAALAAI